MAGCFGAKPRLVIGGLSGDCGKTLVSLALLLLAREKGIPAAAFKKGPDYIDAAWLHWASRSTARNLDTYLMGRALTARAFATHAVPEGLNLIEGNRGLFDGVDAAGTHSTAELAKLLRAPVILVVSGAKVTRTVAASLLGCRTLDPAVPIQGVILNRVAGQRHEALLRESVESVCGIPVLGALPKLDQSSPLPSRHLGLVTPQEHQNLNGLARTLLSLGGNLDLHRIFELAASAPSLEIPLAAKPKRADGRGLKIGYLNDSALTFYYPENLEALEASGARLARLSALRTTALPNDLDALYVGGGFPETHAAAIAGNSSLLKSLQENAFHGLPIYAECGGLMLLSKAIRWRGERFAMSGVFPFEVEVCASPQGHGYVELRVDRDNPFFPPGTRLRGHEFHYSKILPTEDIPTTACAVERGTGSFARRDALLTHSVWASYTHLHAAATPEWADGFLAAARRFSTAKAPSMLSSAS